MLRFPALVTLLTERHDAWIVGSAVDNPNPRDYDVIVPYEKWPQASLLIPKDAKPNVFGGWECISDGKIVDVWPAELGFSFITSACKAAWQPRYNIIIRKEGHASNSTNNAHANAVTA